MRTLGRPRWRRSERRQVNNDDLHPAHDHFGSAFNHDDHRGSPEHAHDDSANDARANDAHHGAQEHAHDRLHDADDCARDHNDGLQLHAVRACDLLLGTPYELRDLGTERFTRD
jgi:hypothetical protein